MGLGGLHETELGQYRQSISELIPPFALITIFARALGAQCPLLAQSGHPASEFRCPLLGVKRTTLITATPEQCAALPGLQQPESTECVRERGKEYAERLAQWLEDHPD